MNIKNIIKNVSYTFSANILSLAASLISTLVLPKVISDVDFGYWQLYLLYISYAGLVHVGICDGIYLRNGGKKYTELDKALLKTQFSYLIIIILAFLLPIATGVSKISFNEYDVKIIRLVCVGAFFHVIKTYFLLILQATNRLKAYSFILILDRVVFVLGVIIQILVGARSFTNVIYADIWGRVLSMLFAIYLCRDIISAKADRDIQSKNELILNIKAGMPLLISGLAGTFIIGIIRIGIEKVWDIVTFGKISLSLSVANMFLSFITMIGIVFFPIIKRIDRRYYRELFRALNLITVLLSLFVLALAVPIKLVIEVWLPNYADFLQLLIVILPMCVFECENQIILTTYLKALRKESIIMILNVIVMIVSMIYTWIFAVLLKNLTLSIMGVVIMLGIKAFITKLYLLKKMNISRSIDEYIEYLLIPVFLVLSHLFSEKVSFILYFGVISMVLVLYRKKLLCYVSKIREIGEAYSNE